MGGRCDATNVINARSPSSPRTLITSTISVPISPGSPRGEGGHHHSGPQRFAGHRRGHRASGPEGHGGAAGRTGADVGGPERLNSRCYGDRSRSAVRYCKTAGLGGLLLLTSTLAAASVNTRRTTRCFLLASVEAFFAPARASSTATPSAEFRRRHQSRGRSWSACAAHHGTIDAPHNPAGASALAINASA